MPDQHSERILEAFAGQAAAFEDARFNRVFTTDASWLFERLECAPGDVVLDVAAGTGLAARELAPLVRMVVAVDITPAMLAAGKLAARAAGLGNVLFLRGDAAALPFLEGSFDVVLSRFAFHHLEDPARVLDEMARCLRPGGRLAVADMVASEDASSAARQDRLEQLRDPSHARMSTPAGLVSLMRNAGLEEISTETREIDRPVEPWLAQAQAGGDRAEIVRSELHAETRGAAETGLHPYERDGELRFVQRWASALAVKPSAR